jgi:hypothetical protein
MPRPACINRLPMKLNEHLLLRLSKKYQPSSMVTMKYHGKDLSFKTDDEGNPTILFIGKMQANGKIKGERYTRTLIHDQAGLLLKDHWDLKGKA